MIYCHFDLVKKEMASDVTCEETSKAVKSE